MSHWLPASLCPPGVVKYRPGGTDHGCLERPCTGYSNSPAVYEDEFPLELNHGGRTVTTPKFARTADGST
jgi:hypothetical protein